MNDTTLDIEKPAGTSSLAEPLTLPCGVTLRNRLAKSAMSEQLGTLQNNPTEQLTTLYGRWGRSGLGMNITGNVMVDRRSLGEPLNVVVEDDRDFTMLQAWANAAKADGAAAIVQINHPGRQIPRGLSSHVVAPSAVQVKLPGAPMPKPRALTSEEVTEQVERFATTAEIVTRAGFDGVQLHGAHGYLISQFLSPIVNLREDQWGGDAERRSRFL
ncbi:MAG: hypothetical protein JHC87_09695, partial [Thermoleophilaceae bacterium]|nr:hypothetical protein [Thermoleophilaceae bacterium]